MGVGCSCVAKDNDNEILIGQREYRFKRAVFYINIIF